jgi:hypothetical protein
MADAPRPHVIQVRLSDDEKRFLDASVAATGLRRSEYVRRVLGGTSLGDHKVGKVERTGDGRQRGGVGAVIRPTAPAKLVDVLADHGPQVAKDARQRTPVLKGGYDTVRDRCPECGSLTYTVARGKRGCRSCRWTGPT